MARKKSLSVQEALALLDELSDDEEFTNADIILTPPTNVHLTDEDSGPEDALSVDNLSGSQLRASATVKMRFKGVASQTVGDSLSENDGEEGLPPKKRDRWRDNNVVAIGSNMHGVCPIVKANRWSNAEKKIIEIDQPNVVSQYNQCLGGRDRMDQNLNAYRCSICSKKWWWPLFVFGMESALQNAWQIYRLCPSSSSKPLDLLSFRREIYLTYFQRSKFNLPGPGRPISKTRRCKVLDSVRYDGLNHYVEVNKTQLRSGNCMKNVTRKCSKCNIGLHEKCFKDFHTK